MSEMRARGDTLQAIATRFGVTRERVRQVINKAGGPGKEQAKAAKAASRVRKNKDIANQVAALMRDGEYEIVVLARKLKVSESKLRAAVGPSISSKFVRPVLQPKKWINSSIVGAIQAAAKGKSSLTTTAYTAAVKAGEVDGPTVIVAIHRFGTWALACEAAGLKGSGTRGRSGSITKSVGLGDLVRFLDSTITPKTAAKYEEWARRRKVTSLGTLRNLYGSWSAALIAGRRKQVK
jgi:hypothetical protein